MYTPPSLAKEIDFPGDFAIGASGRKVRQLQEWLSYHDCATAIDGGFGTATELALKEFQKREGLAVNAKVTQKCWDALVAPMVAATSFKPTATGRSEAILEVAKAHLKQHPVELGGENRGAWVRMYMDGNDGPEWLWCAGFVFYAVTQGCDATGQPVPLKRTFSCDTLAAYAKAAGIFHRGEDIASGKVKWSQLGASCIFLVRHSPGDWSHTGLAFAGNATAFSTIEGNTNDDGSSNGYEVCKRMRSVKDKDFIALA